MLVVLVAGLGVLGWQVARNYAGSNHQTFVKNPASGGDLESYYKKAQLAQPMPAPAETTATFLAVGDIMLSRNVAAKSLAARDPLLPFKGAADLLAFTDFNFANLESPLSGNDKYNPSGSLVFNAVPALAAGLSQYNFKILNLANNHALDQGETGLKYTSDFLDQAGIRRVGLGANLDEAWQPAIVEVRGIKIAFIGASYSSVNDSGQTRNGFVARIDDVERLRKAVAAARQSGADFIVVTMHAGTEYTRTPSAAQTAFAHAAIDADADMVIGAHPHWIQTIEKYQGKYIFYSLGNFIFDQMWSRDTREGLAIKITLSKIGGTGATSATANLVPFNSAPPNSVPSNSAAFNSASPNAAGLNDLQGQRAAATIKQIELVPIIIDNYCCPRVANEEEKNMILNKINQKGNIIF